MSFNLDQLKRYSNKVFVETGSKEGVQAVVAVTLAGFAEAHTVELDPDYYKKAQETIKGHSNIHLYFGSSADWLPKILEKVTDPCTIWLDAHPLVENLDFSNTPLLQDMLTIQRFKMDGKLPVGFKLLIDDMRCYSKTDRNRIEEIARSIGTLSFESQWYPEIERNDILVII